MNSSIPTPPPPSPHATPPPDPAPPEHQEANPRALQSALAGAAGVLVGSVLTGKRTGLLAGFLGAGLRYLLQSREDALKTPAPGTPAALPSLIPGAELPREFAPAETPAALPPQREAIIPPSADSDLLALTPASPDFLDMPPASESPPDESAGPEPTALTSPIRGAFPGAAGADEFSLPGLSGPLFREVLPTPETPAWEPAATATQQNPPDVAAESLLTPLTSEPAAEAASFSLENAEPPPESPVALPAAQTFVPFTAPAPDEAVLGEMLTPEATGEAPFVLTPLVEENAPPPPADLPAAPPAAATIAPESLVHFPSEGETVSETLAENIQSLLPQADFAPQTPALPAGFSPPATPHSELAPAARESDSPAPESPAFVKWPAAAPSDPNTATGEQTPAAASPPTFPSLRALAALIAPSPPLSQPEPPPPAAESLTDPLQHLPALEEFLREQDAAPEAAPSAAASAAFAAPPEESPAVPVAFSSPDLAIATAPAAEAAIEPAAEALLAFQSAPAVPEAPAPPAAVEPEPALPAAAEPISSFLPEAAAIIAELQPEAPVPVPAVLPEPEALTPVQAPPPPAVEIAEVFAEQPVAITPAPVEVLASPVDELLIAPAAASTELPQPVVAEVADAATSLPDWTEEKAPVSLTESPAAEQPSVFPDIAPQFQEPTVETESQFIPESPIPAPTEEGPSPEEIWKLAEQEVVATAPSAEIVIPPSALSPAVSAAAVEPPQPEPVILPALFPPAATAAAKAPEQESAPPPAGAPLAFQSGQASPLGLFGAAAAASPFPVAPQAEPSPAAPAKAAVSPLANLFATPAASTPPAASAASVAAAPSFPAQTVAPAIMPASPSPGAFFPPGHAPRRKAKQKNWAGLAAAGAVLAAGLAAGVLYREPLTNWFKKSVLGQRPGTVIPDNPPDPSALPARRVPITIVQEPPPASESPPAPQAQPPQPPAPDKPHSIESAPATSGAGTNLPTPPAPAEGLAETQVSPDAASAQPVMSDHGENHGGLLESASSGPPNFNAVGAAIAEVSGDAPPSAPSPLLSSPSLTESQPPELPSAATDRPPEKAPASAGNKPGPEAPPTSEEEAQQRLAKDSIRKVLSAASVDELLGFVHEKARIAPAVKSYYSGGAPPPVPMEDIILDSGGKVPDTNAHAFLFRIKTADRPSGFPISVEETAGGYKIDWEAFTQCKDRALKNFWTSTSAYSPQLYVVLRRGHYFDEDIPNIDSLTCLRIDSPNPDEEPCFAFVPKASELGKEVDRRFGWQAKYFIVAEFARLPHSGGSHVEMAKILRTTWRGKREK